MRTRETVKRCIEIAIKMSVIRKDFVEKRVTTLSQIPPEWDVSTKSGYKVNFKMCQIQKLRYDFEWGEEMEPPGRSASIIMMPSRILVVDLSLNELQILDHQGLQAFKNLRHLDASLNRIEKISGIEVLRRLFHLNLSNNFLETLDPALGHCKDLQVFDVSMNRLQEISYMPQLHSLVVLHLNNNQLQSLDGVQSLSHLRELYAQRNQLRDIVPVAGCLRLAVLNASDNNIAVLLSTVDIVRGLKKLYNLSLHGNPIAREATYSSDLINNSTIMMLDNVNIRPLPRLGQPQTKNPNVYSIKDAAKQAFYDVIMDRKRQTEEKVRFLQERIRQIQAEQEEWEVKVMQDMEQCGRYLDTLNETNDFIQYDPNWVRNTIQTPTHSKPWEQLPYIPLDDTHGRQKSRDATPDVKPGHPHGKPTAREDYSGVKNADEVLRHVYNELAVEYTKRHGTPSEKK